MKTFSIFEAGSGTRTHNLSNVGPTGMLPLGYPASGIELNFVTLILDNKHCKSNSWLCFFSD